MTQLNTDITATRAARRAQLLFDRDCAAARRQSLKVSVRPPRTMPLPEQVRPGRF
ncbi:MAG TPA: hypothetical protein VHG70_03170 [Nocardioidaceae bacterium]|jgi:hypothetical protein|nr:hypothetical protein [Nocardioidaceae bacterium]